MRLWSLHPGYLDSKGLVALWREGLLAQNVLLGKTKGYKNHPQLIRFKNKVNPVKAISNYLHYLVDEADKRNYNFIRDKIVQKEQSRSIQVNQGQLEYEYKHLLEKLKVRDPDLHIELRSIKKIKPHPLFTIIEGGVESWEIIH